MQVLISIQLQVVMPYEIIIADDGSDSDTKKTIETLEDITNSKIDNYSFPEGTDDFFDNKCIDILKKFNISFCPTAIEGINNRITLPNYNSFRIMVGFEKIKFPFLIN